MSGEMTFATSRRVYAPLASSSLVVISHVETSPVMSIIYLFFHVGETAWPNCFASSVKGGQPLLFWLRSAIFWIDRKTNHRQTFPMVVSGALPLFTKHSTLTCSQHVQGPSKHVQSAKTEHLLFPQLVASNRGQANPAPAFSAVRQLKAHMLLASSGGNVRWQTSAFALSSHPSVDMLSLHKAHAQDQPPTGWGGNLYNPSDWKQTLWHSWIPIRD